MLLTRVNNTFYWGCQAIYCCGADIKTAVVRQKDTERILFLQVAGGHSESKLRNLA